MSIRWHTDPNPAFFQTPKPPKELSDLININSETALYFLIQQTIANNPTKPPNLKLEGEDIEWLKSIETSFDSYVTRILNTLHIEPWDYDHCIKDEYAKVYGTPYVSTYGGGGSIRSVMGRLMTYKEIWNYAREAEDRTRCSNTNGSDWFWRRPEPKPVWSNSSNFSSSSFHSNDGRMPFMTGIHPKDKNRVYTVTYKKPWCSSSRFSELDPAHNWGVFIDQTASYTDDLPIRVLMACCAEPVGKTEGCWIALPEDKSAVEGIIKPYRVYHSVFNSVWSNISNNSPLPTTFQNDIKKDYSIGTAFQDVSKYEELHQRIKKALEDAAPIIEQAYKDYQAELQATLDRLEEAGDSQRNTDPFSTLLKTKEQQDAVTLPIRLRDEFNAIQAIDMDKPDGPLVLKDHVNQRVFQVGEMLKEFTFAKMGGFLLATTGERLRMLKRGQLETTSNIATFTNLIDSAPAERYTVQLKKIQKAASQIGRRIEAIELTKQRRDEIKSLDEKFTSLNRDTKLLPPAPFDWALIVGPVKQYDDIIRETILKQEEINESVRLLKTGQIKDVNANITAIPKVLKTTKEENDFKENMDVEIVKKNVPMKDEVEPLLTNAPTLSPVELNEQYRLVANAYQRANDLQKDANLPIAAQGKVKERPGFKTALETVEKTLSDQNKLLESLKKNLRQSIARLLYINNLNVSNDVKRRSVVELGISDRITNLDLLNTTIETKKNDARKNFEQALKIEIDAYNQEQNKNKTNATTVLATFDTNNQKLIIDDTTGIEKLKNNLLAAVAPLAVIDDLEQLYVNYNAKLQTVFSNLPEATLVAQAPKAKEYINAWQTSVLAASIALAQALQNLIVNLNDVNTKSTDDALATLETEVTTAKALVETEEARKIRLAREAAAKAEEERRIKLLIQNDNVYAKKLFDWLNDANRTMIASTEPLAKLAALENAFNFKYENLPGERSKTWTSTPKVRQGNVKKDFEEIYNRLQSMKNFFRPSVVPGRPPALPAGLKDDNSISSPSFENAKEPFSALYVQNYDTSTLIRVYKAYAMYLITEMYVDDSVRTNLKKDLLDEFSKLEKLPFPEQPIFIQTVPNPNDKYDVSSIQMIAPPMLAGKSIFTFTAPQWKDSSCWLDSAIVSLFSIPQTTWVKNLFATKEIYNKGIELQFQDSTKRKIIFDYQNDCTPTNINDLHTSLLTDITFLQKESKEREVCSTRVRLSEAKGCLKRAPIVVGEQESPETFYDSFVFLYGKDKLGIEYTEQDWVTHGSELRVRNPLASTKAYILNASQYFQPKVKQTLKTTGFNVNVGLDNNFYLSAIVVKSGEVGSGHFTTFLFDFASEKWVFFNVIGENKEVGWVSDLSVDTDYTGKTRQAKLIPGIGLPEGVFDFEGIKQLGVFNGYKPAFFVFISRDEKESILDNWKKANKTTSIPTPSTLWESPFKTTTPDEILKTISPNLSNTTTEKEWLIKLGLFNSVTEELITDANELGDSPAIRYAYFHFSIWLGELDPDKRAKLEIKIRKALAAAQPIPEEQELKDLGIKRFPDDLRITNALKKVLLPQIQKKPLETVVVRKRVFAARFQIKFSELEN